MPARPPESPIDVSSTSPTPTRPPISLPRRSSSRLREVNEALPVTAPARRRSSENEASFQIPPPRQGGPSVLMPSNPRLAAPLGSRPRHGLAIPTAPAAAGPSRATQAVIDLTEDDDDDIEFTGQAAPVRPAAEETPAEHEERMSQIPMTGRAWVRSGMGEEWYPPGYDVNAWRQGNRIEQGMDERVRATRAAVEERENDHARQNALANIRRRAAATRREQVERYNDENPPPPDSPPPAQPPAPRGRIGLGGAVLRRGGQQIIYQPPTGPPPAPAPARPPPARRHRNGYPPPDEYLPQYEQRMRERIDRVRRAREAQHAGHPGMIEGILENLMRDDPDRERMEALLNRLRPIHANAYNPAARAQFEEPSVITARQPFPVPLDIPEGFTSDFELNDTIEIDQPRHAKRYMACIRCGDPLFLNDGQKSQADRVWGLRCGHLLDQKCLFEISGPQEEKDRLNILRPPPGGLDILGDEGKVIKKARGGKRKGGRKTVNEPVEYDWKCPVASCGWKHVSVLKEAEWTQDEEEGAVQLYV